MSEKTRFSLQKPPLLSVYFWAVDKEKAREDNKIMTSQEQRLRIENGGPMPNNLLAPQVLLPYVMNATNGSRVQQWRVGFPNAKEWASVGQQGQFFTALSIPSQLTVGPGAELWPLSKLLERHNARFIRKEMVGGVETYKLESPVTTEKDFLETWWIAPSRSYLFLKRETRSTPGVASRYSSKRDVTIVDKLVKVGDSLWIPAVTRSVSYATSKDSKQEAWSTMERYSLQAFKVNQPVPSRLFDLPLPPGTSVSADEDQGTHTVPGDLETFEIELAKAKKRGEQPDLESIDLTPFKARIAKGQPAPEETLDVPIQNLADDK